MIFACLPFASVVELHDQVLQLATNNPSEVQMLIKICLDRKLILLEKLEAIKLALAQSENPFITKALHEQRRHTERELEIIKFYEKCDEL